MNEFILGMALMAASTGASPMGEVRHQVGPLSERSQTPWQMTPMRAARATTTKRHSTVEKIIGVTAGICVGFVVGGTLVGYAMDKGPEADGAAIYGVMIGAPIGATVGAILGYQMTKK